MILNFKKGISLIIFLAVIAVNVYGQTSSISNESEKKEVPQWVKDLRRWEIVTFGSFPFTMFTATFAMDMFRWSQANGMDFSDAGRRYAPWPLKSAGAPAMDRKEQEITITIAASYKNKVADVIVILWGHLVVKM